MPDTDPRVRLRTPAELIATLPYLLGYRLRDSLVVVAVDGGRLGLIQRFDLAVSGYGLPSRRAVDVARRMLRREDPDAVMIVACETSPGSGTPLRTAISRLCRRNGWEVMVEVVTRGERWWDVAAGDELAGPGRPLPDPQHVPAVAECVAAGLAPLPGRAALTALFEPSAGADDMRAPIDAERRRRTSNAEPPLERYRLDALAWRAWLADDPGHVARDDVFDHASRDAADHDSAHDPAHDPDHAQDRALGHARPDAFDAGSGRGPAAEPAPVARASTGVAPLSPKCLAICVVSLEDTDFRDALIAWLAPGLLPPPTAPYDAYAVLTDVLGAVPQSGPRHRQGRLEALRERGQNRLIDAIRATPADDQVALLTVFGSITWWQGDGARAGEAAHRARRLRPSYTLAVLLSEMIRQGIRFGSTSGRIG